MKIKLAEALLRRKELAAKVAQTGAVKNASIFETKIQRKQINENIDDIVATVAKLTLSQVTAEHDHYSRALRLVDAAIQQTNWTAEIEVDARSMQSFDEWNESRAVSVTK